MQRRHLIIAPKGNGSVHGLVYQVKRRYKNRTTRTMHHLYLLRQQLQNAIFNQTVYLSTTNFHDSPRPDNRLFRQDIDSPTQRLCVHAGIS